MTLLSKVTWNSSKLKYLSVNTVVNTTTSFHICTVCKVVTSLLYFCREVTTSILQTSHLSSGPYLNTIYPPPHVSNLTLLTTQRSNTCILLYSVDPENISPMERIWSWKNSHPPLLSLANSNWDKYMYLSFCFMVLAETPSFPRIFQSLP